MYLRTSHAFFSLQISQRQDKLKVNLLKALKLYSIFNICSFVLCVLLIILNFSMVEFVMFVEQIFTYGSSSFALPALSGVHNFFMRILHM